MACLPQTLKPSCQDDMCFFQNSLSYSDLDCRLGSPASVIAVVQRISCCNFRKVLQAGPFWSTSMVSADFWESQTLWRSCCFWQLWNIASGVTLSVFVLGGMTQRWHIDHKRGDYRRKLFDYQSIQLILACSQRLLTLASSLSAGPFHRLGP